MIGCVLAIVLVCGVTFSQERREYGRQWQQLDLSQRTLYLSGLQEGAYNMMFFAKNITGDLPSEDELSNRLVKELNLNQSQKHKIDTLMEKRLKEINISSLGTGVVADVMVNLYKDPANIYIPWDEISKVAVMRLQGKPEDDVIRALQTLRQAIDRLYEGKNKHSNE